MNFANRSGSLMAIFFFISQNCTYFTLYSNRFCPSLYVKYLDNKKTTTTEIFKWIQSHYGYANIIMGIFIAFWTKLFFKKYHFNFFEILILLCFVMGMGMLIYSVFGIIQGLTHIDLMQVAGIVGFIYTTWSVGHFFDKTKIVSYVKAFFAYILGMLTFTLTAMLLGFLIDLIIRH